jgi:uncharacterized membrane-anchored protein
LKHSCYQTGNIDWIKRQLIEINRKCDITGLAIITIQNQNTEIKSNTGGMNERIKAQKNSVNRLWGIVLTAIGAAIVGVIVYLLKYHHVHA